MSNATESPLTVVVARRIRPGCEGEYERTMREFVAWSLTLDVDRAGPRFLRIARAIADDVRRGRLVAGQRLPGSRTLAVQLGSSWAR